MCVIFATTNHTLKQFTMADVWAERNGKKRRFTKISWDLLGKDKDGWVALPDTVVHNAVDKSPLQKPSTGDKKTAPSQVVDNLVSKKSSNDGTSMDNALEDNTGSKVDEASNDKSSSNTEVKNLVEQKQEFFKAAAGLKRGDIKDYFDRQTPPVPYKNTAKVEELIEILGNRLGWDVIELQKNLA